MFVDAAGAEPSGRERLPILYLAPWVDFGGSDKGTIDWFRWLDRDRFAPSLITTQPSDNRRLHEIYPFAEEVWALPDHLAGSQFPRFVFDFIHTRGIRILHIMNSRLAYELLPDLAALPKPPKVVVQLHVEEVDRSGYVRYVTTRYGNLVDAFSVTSHHLAQIVRDYQVPGSRVHVVPTGVDAQGEFNPDRVEPLETAAESGAFRILFAGRLTEQKDPLLMVEVVRRLAERNPELRVDVVGDGHLEGPVRASVRDAGLDGVIRLHPSSPELARWLRSTDLLLMTSVFEGVPYVVYEALAMGVPVVAPSLPGNVELVGEVGGILVDDRGDADAYAGAIQALISAPELRGWHARSGRARMLRSFSLRDMATGHESIYEALLVDKERGKADAPPTPAQPKLSGPPLTPLTFWNRPVAGTPLVSIVTPCFNHGRYLGEYLGGIEAQDYPAIETIIVDDGSTDAETYEALDDIEREGRARVLRLSDNRGPSSARNRAIAEARGRYILPVDADNVLLPGAVSALVSQLQAAGERVGLIYASFQFFGTRDYRFDAPDFNLFSLLNENFMDTCALLDRSIFDIGLRYADDIELGHEDWDLALALAARGVHGEPSREPVMMYRKQGFTRSDLVEYLRLPFSREIRSRHPELFGGEGDLGAWGWHRGPAVAIKASWNPALSIMLPEPVDFGSEAGIALRSGLERQVCRDFEVIAECPRLPTSGHSVVRRLPPDPGAERTERLQQALDLSRGRCLLISSAPVELFSQPTAVEAILRAFAISGSLDAVALTDLRDAGRYPFRILERVSAGTEAHTVAWRRELHDQLGAQAVVAQGSEAGDVAELIHRSGARVQWRHCEDGAASGYSPETTRTLVLERPASGSASAREERKRRLTRAPAIPAIPIEWVPRWNGTPAWMPPETLPLVRHREVAGERRVVTNDRVAPPGFQIEWDIGSIQRFSPPGTVRLVQHEGRFITVARGTERDPDAEVLGYLESTALPLFSAVRRVALPDGSETLALATERDPLFAAVGPGEFLGFIEMYPNGPYHSPQFAQVEHVSLMRFLDIQVRRHRYGAVSDDSHGESDAPGQVGVLTGELGELLGRGGPGRLALWADEHGRLSTERQPVSVADPTLKQALRWVGAPATWRGFGYRTARPRAIARRLVGAVVALDLLPRRPTGLFPAPLASLAQPTLLGYVHRDLGPGRKELFVAVHPVMSDQFVTHYPLEATDLGYTNVVSLGFIDARAPRTGVLGGRAGAIPWASRFGHTARQG